MLSVSTASCGMSLQSCVATTERRIFFHLLCFYLMFYQFQWVVPSSAIEGFCEQQFCIYFIWDLDDFVNFDHIHPQPPPLLTGASFILVILFIWVACPCLFSATLLLSKGVTCNDVTDATVGTRKCLNTPDWDWDWDQDQGSITLGITENTLEIYSLKRWGKEWKRKEKRSQRASYHSTLQRTWIFPSPSTGREHLELPLFSDISQHFIAVSLVVRPLCHHPPYGPCAGTPGRWVTLLWTVLAGNSPCKTVVCFQTGEVHLVASGVLKQGAGWE